jgi:carbonic anhydrase
LRHVLRFNNDGRNIKDHRMSNAQQSPINLFDPIYAELGDRSLKIEWPNDIKGHLVESDHGLKINFSPDQRLFITLDRKRFHLVSFHFHHPSEHWINGQQHSVELHVVHQNLNDGSLAVVGIFIEVGDGEANDRAMMSGLKQALSASAEHRSKVAIPTTPSAFIPPTPEEYFRYEGSLTTPEYSETVSWVIMRNPLLMDKDSLSELIADAGGEARFPQPLNRRFTLATFRPEVTKDAEEIAAKGTKGKR